MKMIEEMDQNGFSAVGSLFSDSLSRLIIRDCPAYKPYRIPCSLLRIIDFPDKLLNNEYNPKSGS
jgi:hypothetical protein